MIETKITGLAVLQALNRIKESGRNPIFHDLVEEFEPATSPESIGDALRSLKDAGVVDFKEPFYPDTVIEIIHIIE